MPQDPIRDVRLKIQRADKHICEVEAAYNAFIFANSSPSLIEYDLDARKVRYIWEWERVELIDTINLASGDAIHNLRSALDAMIYCVVAKHGFRIPESACKLPFDKDRESFERAAKQARIKKAA